MTGLQPFRDRWSNLAYLSLFILLIVEFVGDYDVLQRKIALAITNLFVMIVYYVLYQKLRRKYNITLPGFIAWAAVLGVWLDAAGNFAHFYWNVSWWDNLTHFEGSLSLAVILLFILHKLRSSGFLQLSPFHIGLYTISLTMLLVSLYEISEFIGDILFNTQRVGPRYDTASDLLYNLLGALAVVWVGSYLFRRKKTTPTV